MKTKEILRKAADPLMAVSALLYVIALCIGITNGIIPYVLLLLSTWAITILLIEAVINKRSLSTWLYRFIAFFVCWAGIFANQKEPMLEGVCAILAFICIAVLILMFVYYMNTQNTKDVEERLNS